MHRLARRRFLQSTAALAAAPFLPAAPSKESFSFVLLGDLHYDKLDHHHMPWLEKNKAGDLSQIKNYSRITADITPRLFDAVKQSIAATHASFVLQVGDLVEGLCGTEEHATRQDSEALAFVESGKLGVPFYFTKGNHDVTGDGATDAFKTVFHPFLAKQTKQKIDRACYTIEHGDALFCFFDAYDKESLAWLEAALGKRTARHCFVVIHPPVVPYGARATWNLYSSDRDKTQREKLLTLLGKQNAIVLGGHIHRYNTLVRETPGGGRFTQLAISSIVNSADVKPDTELHGIAQYNGDQINVEPKHSPETASERRAVYAVEAPFVKAFEYADLPGHAVVTVGGTSVTVTMHRGITREIWKQVDLTKLVG
ncbi:MAG: metallophosphoesterase [Verrucomicrobiaceae bacterium]|nr:metallophosphoesterase [Verrucomicrobiaceae bacterium]